ncbi:MAG: rod shape-determining protein MreD [Deltaproteobacteria bacterium]|jgi:rod shape-determining protein MreD|nr:rod shape-determining protein MreD [Deltaproteobacteria bacterium]MDA8308050.1 rod shape-determining protein MreD [Deltaproteobacteria bacterium]
MTVSRSFSQEATLKKAVKFSLFGLLFLALQAQVIPRLPYAALRIDLFLPFMFALAVECSPLSGVLGAGLLGFTADVFSGEFWGLHVGSYIVTVCLVYMASENFDWRNPAYQMGLVGLCAFGQSVALGLFVSYVPMDSVTLTSIWVSLGIRTLLSAIIAPLLIYPLLNWETING